MPKAIKKQEDIDSLNQRELGYIAEYLLERVQSEESQKSVPDVIEFVSDFLKGNKIALDVDDHTLELKELLFRLISKNKMTQLFEVLKKWAAGYEAAAKLAEKQAEENKRIFAAQPHGIYRGLIEKQKIGYTVWGEDLDILVLLKGIVTMGPKDISEDGIYILPPVSIEGLKDKLKEVRDAHSDKALTLLVPVNRGQNHWQLAIADAKNGKVTGLTIWDSIKEGVQKNGYSCMDFSVRQALTIKFANKAPTPDLQAIIDAKDAQQLREAVVNRILHVHSKMKDDADLHQSVREQVAQRPQVEKIQAIDINNEDQLHVELLKNRNMQEEFDGLMAIELDKLYKDNQDEDEDEEDLIKIARKLAYQIFLTKFGMFAHTSKTPAPAAVAQPKPIL